MKKLIILSILSLSLALGVSAQTALEDGGQAIRLDKSFIKGGAVGDTLNLNDSITHTYYIKDFTEQVDLFWNLDSISGTPSIRVDLDGSYIGSYGTGLDEDDWVTINSTTLTPSLGDTTFVQSASTYLYPYVRVKATALTGAQNVKWEYALTLKTN